MDQRGHETSNGKCDAAPAKCKKLNFVALYGRNETGIGRSKFNPDY